MKLFATSILGAAVLAAGAATPKANMLPDAARPEVAAAVERGAQKPHPRLFADAADFAALRERVKTDELVRLGAECVRGRADEFLAKSPSERKLVGRRLLAVSRETLQRVTTLAMAYRLSGDRRHLDRAVAELRAVCAFPDWNPSHFLDVAEMSMAVATGYDWLYGDLDEATRREIAAALRKHGLDASRQAKRWITTGNNWNQVCHAGILAAALALAEENPPETARFVQRAIDCLPIAMAAYAPNGNFPEGPGYWVYATNFNVLAIRLLEGVLGSDFGLLSLPGFRETARYLDYVTGPSGRLFNYADGSDRRGSAMSLWWLARRFEHPEILPYFEIAAYRRFCKTWRGAERRTFAYELLDVRTPPAEVETDLPRVWNGGGTSPVAVMRSSWDDEKAMFVGLKGGSPKVNHGHMDVGSFVLDTKGVRWAIDLGPENYAKIEKRGMRLWNMEQASDRWKVYRLNAWSHNELVLDGCPQSVDGFGKVVEAREIEGGAALRTTLDLTSLYTNATEVARRGTLASDGARFELRDVVRGLRPGAPIRWAMATRAKVEPQADGSLLLREGGQTLRLAQTGALTGAWRVAPAKGPNEWDAENRGVTQITFEVAMPSDGAAHLAVTFSRSPTSRRGGIVDRALSAGDAATLPLAGEWRFALGATNALTDTIRLPTTTDLARKGDGRLGGEVVERIHPELLGAKMARALTFHPSRRFPFVGVARYERDVEMPASWEGRRVSLFLERTKIVRAFWDGVCLGRRDTLAAPAVFDLPDGARPGRHVLRLEVDNRIDGIPVSGHQVSDDTQTNWNGVMGRMELRAEGATRFGRIRLFPDPATRTVGVEAEVLSPAGAETNRQTIALAQDAALWSEFTPVLHEIEVRVGGLSRRMKVGLRSFAAKGTQFAVNGRPTFLRGRHDACVWPLTGAAPMDVESWRGYFRTLKDYGLNHVRFHSWCPPEAAFAAADELGFYLQPEFACFGGDWSRPALREYCLAESKRILDAYGNHPSFVMFSLANEPGTERERRAATVEELRAYDPRPLYAQGTNADFRDPRQCPADDFWATFRSVSGADGNVRGSYALGNSPLGGVQLPGGGTTRDFSSATAHSSVPLVGHETGQYQVYPDYSEIAKWTGPLKPVNLEIFRERLNAAGMGGLADAFFRASGALAVLNYREDVEEALRTPGFGGFQLLDLQDFTGQGTALVGILNAFMESKGLVAPAAWRGFCAPTVLLARFPSYTHEAGGAFAADIQVAHYGAEDLLRGRLDWRLVEAGEEGRPVPSAKGGAVVAQGSVAVEAAVGSSAKVGEIRARLPSCAAPKRLSLELSLAGRAERNAYPLWVYPKSEAAVPQGVAVVKSIGEGERLLAEGRRALCVLSRENAPTNAVAGAFASDFWNFEMFNGRRIAKGLPTAPGTLGLLVDAAHPALAGFPTESHSDYQWREMMFRGVNVVLDGDSDARIIVQGIDNVTRNHRLGVIYEKRRGAGRLVVCAIDLDACADLPEGRALRRSLLDYLGSDPGSR